MCVVLTHQWENPNYPKLAGNLTKCLWPLELSAWQCLSLLFVILILSLHVYCFGALKRYLTSFHICHTCMTQIIKLILIIYTDNTGTWKMVISFIKWKKKPKPNLLGIL